MADARISETAFLPAEELRTKYGYEWEDWWGLVGCVVSYQEWDLCGVEVLMIPLFPPYKENVNG